MRWMPMHTLEEWLAIHGTHNEAHGKFQAHCFTCVVSAKLVTEPPFTVDMTRNRVATDDGQDTQMLY
jgi:hypothetical protein